nr:MAG TPA: hypothetical protein [Caudoviricetes sp.]
MFNLFRHYISPFLPFHYFLLKIQFCSVFVTLQIITERKYSTFLLS